MSTQFFDRRGSGFAQWYAQDNRFNPYVYLRDCRNIVLARLKDRVWNSIAEKDAAYLLLPYTEEIRQSVEQLFPKRSVQGWFLCGAPGNDLSPLNYWKQHVQYFQGPNKLMYLSSGAEGDESVYITSEDGFYKLCGYSIYYERNQMMQDYMVLRKDVKRIESGSDEKVIQEFRKRMDEHKDEVTDRHQTLGLLRGMCMAMSIVILAGGIVMFNNYERMQEMESVIASAIPERVESALMGKDNAAGKDKPESHVVVEEAEGGVYPTTAAVTKETMSETQPAARTAPQPTAAVQKMHPETRLATAARRMHRRRAEIRARLRRTVLTARVQPETRQAGRPGIARRAEAMREASRRRMAAPPRRRPEVPRECT